MVRPILPEHLQRYVDAQFGLLTWAQGLEALNVAALQRLVSRGILIRFDRGVYRLVGAAPSWRQRAMGRCLAAGPDAVVSHLAGAHLWQAQSVAAPQQIQLTLPPNRRSGRLDPRPRRLPLPPVDLTERWGIPTTTPARTIIDLSSTVGPPLLGRIVDDLVRARHLRVEDIQKRRLAADPLPRYRSWVIDDMLRLRLVRGIGVSPKEDWMLDTIRAAGLAMPVRNLIVEVGGRLFELDLAYPDRKIGIEYDGLEVHGDRRHFHSDREKVALLQLDGWLILQVTAAWSAELLVERVSAALAQRQP